MKKQHEYQLQKTIARYLTIQYPHIKFLSDTIATLKLTIPQKARNKAIQCNNFKCPDILILQPNKTHYGLFIELKIETIFKKNGALKSNEHVEEQQKEINNLNSLNYFCLFSWTFEMTEEIIKDYLNNQSKEPQFYYDKYTSKIYH